MGILANYELTKDEIIRKTMKYMLMFMLTYLICFSTPKQKISYDDTIIISFIMSCCLVILDLYFPIIKLENTKTNKNT